MGEKGPVWAMQRQQLLAMDAWVRFSKDAAPVLLSTLADMEDRGFDSLVHTLLTQPIISHSFGSQLLKSYGAAPDPPPSAEVKDPLHPQLNPVAGPSPPAIRSMDPPTVTRADIPESPICSLVQCPGSAPPFSIERSVVIPAHTLPTLELPSVPMELPCMDFQGELPDL